MDKSTIYPAVAIISGLVFFHTVISPASEDIRKDSFTLSPDNTFLKLVWSLLGGTAICIMDTAIPLMVSSLIAVGNITDGIAFIPIVVSVDFFASAAGIFTQLAIPSSVDKTFKQVLQILLLYFALIPDILIVSSGIIRGTATTAFVMATSINMVFGLLFFGFSGVILEPTSGFHVKKKVSDTERKKGLSTFGFTGATLCVCYLTVFALQLFLPRLVQSVWPDSSILYTLAYFIPVYAVGFSLAFLAVSHLPKTAPIETKHLKIPVLLTILPVCFFVMYSGSILGFAVQTWLQTTFPLSIRSFATQGEMNEVMQMVCAVLIAPVMEELLFRKCIIDRTVSYGEFNAVLFSALTFGLFHGNIQQFFYAFFLGLVFGAIYVKTSNIRISIFTHMIINFMGSVIAPSLANYVISSGQDTGIFNSVSLSSIFSSPALLTIMTYVIVLFIFSMLGAVLLTHYSKTIHLRKTDISFSEILVTPGVIGFMSLILCAFAYNTFNANVI